MLRSPPYSADDQHLQHAIFPTDCKSRIKQNPKNPRHIALMELAASIGPPMIPPMLAAAKDANLESRRAAMLVFAQMKTNDKRVIDLMQAAVNDPDRLISAIASGGLKAAGEAVGGIRGKSKHSTIPLHGER